MPLAALYVSGIAYAAYSILGVGFALLASLRRLGLAKSEGGASQLLSAAALGVYWATIFVTIAFLAGTSFSHGMMLRKLGWDTGIIVIGLVVGWREIVVIGQELRKDRSIIVVAALGLLIGTWAFQQFPHVADSGQIKWIQTAFRAGATEISPMLGYTGLVFPVGRQFAEFPLITTASAFKPFLAFLLSVLCFFAATELDLRPRLLNSLLLLALAVFSVFGMYGVVELGKDSIFGIIFGMAFLVTLCRQDSHRGGLEGALYFAAAASTGVIAVPYMLATYVIWLCVTRPAQKPLSTLVAMWLVNFPILPIAIAGMIGKSLWAVTLAYIGMAALTLGLARLPWTMPRIAVWRRIVPFLPVICALGAFFLMPATAEILTGRGPNAILRPPLDGHMTFLGYLFTFKLIQRFTVGAGLLVAFCIGFTRLGKERPGLVAIATMPLAVILGILLRIHLQLPILSNFNMWDMSKDIIMWLGGTLFALLAVVGLNLAAAKLKDARQRAAAVSIAGLLLVSAAARSIVWPPYTEPVVYTASGGWADPDMAVASDALWRKLRGRTIMLDADLNLTAGNFHTLGMYDTKTVLLTLPMPSNVSRQERVGLILRNEKLPSLQQYAAETKASLIFETRLDNGEASLFALVFDGKSRIEIPADAIGPVITSGAYPNETFRGTEFRWMKESATILVPLVGSDHACLTMKLFSTGRRPAGPEILRIESSSSDATEVNLAGTDIQQPSQIRIPIKADADGWTRLHVTNQAPKLSFPGDTRELAHGLQVPMRLDTGKDCGSV